MPNDRQYSLEQQAQAITHCVEFARANGLSSTIIEAGDAALVSLRFLAEHADAYKALHRLLTAFPDAVHDPRNAEYFPIDHDEQEQVVDA